MTKDLIDTDATAGGRRLRGPFECLVAHPTVRVMCAAAAFSTSLYAIKRSIRPATKLKRAAWTALAAVTAVEGVGVLAVLPQAQASPRPGMGSSA
jgi:hypothetical protein